MDNRIRKCAVKGAGRRLLNYLPNSLKARPTHSCANSPSPSSRKHLNKSANGGLNDERGQPAFGVGADSLIT